VHSRLNVPTMTMGQPDLQCRLLILRTTPGERCCVRLVQSNLAFPVPPVLAAFLPNVGQCRPPILRSHLPQDSGCLPRCASSTDAIARVLQGLYLYDCCACCVPHCDVCSMNWPKVVKGAVHLDVTLSMHKDALLEVCLGPRHHAGTTSGCWHITHWRSTQGASSSWSIVHVAKPCSNIVHVAKPCSCCLPGRAQSWLHPAWLLACVSHPTATTCTPPC